MEEVYRYAYTHRDRYIQLCMHDYIYITVPLKLHGVHYNDSLSMSNDPARQCKREFWQFILQRK